MIEMNEDGFVGYSGVYEIRDTGYTLLIAVYAVELLLPRITILYRSYHLLEDGIRVESWCQYEKPMADTMETLRPGVYHASEVCEWTAGEIPGWLYDLDDEYGLGICLPPDADDGLPF